MKSRNATIVAIAAIALSSCSGTGTGTDPADVPEASVSTPAASSTPTPTPEEAGSLSIYGAVGLGPGAIIPNLPEEGACSAHSEYADIEEGVQVSILDAAGTVVAVGELSEGRLFEGGDCGWTFDIDDVPAGGGFYRAQVLEWQSELVPEDDAPGATFIILPAGSRG